VVYAEGMGGMNTMALCVLHCVNLQHSCSERFRTTLLPSLGLCSATPFCCFLHGAIRRDMQEEHLSVRELGVMLAVVVGQSGVMVVGRWGS
jgi:hypothetical protein